MKKKLILLSTVVLTATMLGGCFAGPIRKKSRGKAPVPSFATPAPTKPPAAPTPTPVPPKKVYGMGQNALVVTKKGNYHVTITGVKETDERNIFSNAQADRVIVVSYEYENISYSSDLSINNYNFIAYDNQGYRLEKYSFNSKSGGSVAQGRKSTGSVAYILNNEINHIELDYYDNTFNDKADCMFVLDW